MSCERCCSVKQSAVMSRFGLLRGEHHVSLQMFSTLCWTRVRLSRPGFLWDVCSWERPAGHVESCSSFLAAPLGLSKAVQQQLIEWSGYNASNKHGGRPAAQRTRTGGEAVDRLLKRSAEKWTFNWSTDVFQSQDDHQSCYCKHTAEQYETTESTRSTTDTTKVPKQVQQRNNDPQRVQEPQPSTTQTLLLQAKATMKH